MEQESLTRKPIGLNNLVLRLSVRRMNTFRPRQDRLSKNIRKVSYNVSGKVENVGMATRLSDAAARKIMLAAGLKPVTPYISSSSPWIPPNRLSFSHSLSMHLFSGFGYCHRNSKLLLTSED